MYMCVWGGGWKGGVRARLHVCVCVCVTVGGGGGVRACVWRLGECVRVFMPAKCTSTGIPVGRGCPPSNSVTTEYSVARKGTLYPHSPVFSLSRNSLSEAHVPIIIFTAWIARRSCVQPHRASDQQA